MLKSLCLVSPAAADGNHPEQITEVTQEDEEPSSLPPPALVPQDGQSAERDS